MEEPECLVQSDSICRKLDIDSVLRGSISFGRFASEPLEWGKWSTFSQNRYLEEAQTYSTRGSVAEKKAYFEAHYKRIAAKKAAELIEQATASAAEDDDGVGNSGSSLTEAGYSASWQSDGQDDGACGGVASETEPENHLNWEPNGTYCGTTSAIDTISTELRVFESDSYETKLADMPAETHQGNSGSCGETSHSSMIASHYEAVEENRCHLGPTRLDGVDRGNNIMGSPPQPETRLENEDSQIQQDFEKIHKLSDMEQSKLMPLNESSPLQVNSNMQIYGWDKTESSAHLSKPSIPTRKPVVLPPPSSANHQNTTDFHDKENNPTPGSRNKPRKRINDKATSLPVSQSPQQKGKSGTPEISVPPKPDKAWSPKVAFSCFRACQDLTRARGTRRKASAKETTTKVEASQGDVRSKFTSGKSTVQSTRNADGRWQSLVVNPGKSSNCTSSMKENSQSASSSCFDQSEDREEKRKEFFRKLEEKLNVDKAQRQLKAKENAENELKLLRPNLCFLRQDHCPVSMTEPSNPSSLI